MNFETEQPCKHAYFYGEVLQTDILWSNSELLHSLETMTVEQLQSFINNVYLPQVFIESLMMGNLTAQGSYLNFIKL